MDNSLLCVGLLVLLAVVGLAIAYSNDQQKKEARKKYQNALEFLRQHPDNADAREAALLYGRAYVSTLGKKSTYTEVSLMNDLNAIQPTVQQIPASQAATGDVKTRLANLESLYNEGVITKEEYQTRRNEILSEL